MKPLSAVLSARSEVIEARMDGRVAEMKGEIRALIVRMDERDGRNEETFSVIRKQIVNLKYIVVTTAVASVIGLYAANVATMQALLSAYDSGKSIATIFAQAAERIQKTNERLDIFEQRLNEKNDYMEQQLNERLDIMGQKLDQKLNSR
jgi:multidrug efflux pump subunit AcrB